MINYQVWEFYLQVAKNKIFYQKFKGNIYKNRLSKMKD